MAKAKKERKPNDLFGCLNAICNKKPPIIYDKKEASAFIIMLWLSHEYDLMPWVDKINTNKLVFNVPDELTYKYFYDKIPKKKRFIKWIKKSKLSESKEKELKELCDKYNISKREAMMSL